MPQLSRLRYLNIDRTKQPVGPRRRSRGVPIALQDHEVVTTSDLPTSQEVVSRLLGPTRLTVEGRAESFATTLNAVRFLDVTMAYLDLHVEATLEVPKSADCFTVHMTTNGTAEVTLDGERHEVTAFFTLVASPGSAYSLHLGADSPQPLLRFERAAVERQLSRMLGRSLDAPIVFEPFGDLTQEEAVRWHGAIQILSSEVVSPHSLIQQGVGAVALEELLISTLLYIQGSNYADLVRSTPKPSGRAAVRRSLEYIEQHLAEPISLADLSRHSGMSARSIQAGFRDDLRTTPISYIRDRRLDRARETLMQALPEDGVTVTEVAQHWGFGHLGSFAVLYRKRFGESPSQTLKS